MKIYAFMSDIHGNSPALAAVLADIAGRGIETVYNLGDSLFGPLDPHGTFELLTSRPITHLRGNGDRELLLPDDGSLSTMNLNRRLLTDQVKEWLAGLPITIKTEDFLLFHGSPEADDQYLLEDVSANGAGLKSPDELHRALAGVRPPVVVCGHSYLPRIVQLPDGLLIVNAGSVGLPAYKDDWPAPHKMESGSPQAKYVILEKTAAGWRAEIIQVPYDWRAAAEMARAQNRYDWAFSLETGFAPV